MPGPRAAAQLLAASTALPSSAPRAACPPGQPAPRAPSGTAALQRPPASLGEEACTSMIPFGALTSFIILIYAFPLIKRYQDNICSWFGSSNPLRAIPADSLAQVQPALSTSPQ